jgi:C1A family cysteine protease
VISYALVDLRLHCSPIKYQHDIKCSPSCAVTSLYEFRFNVITGKKCVMSPLFNYKTTKNLLQKTGNVACSVNNSMTAQVLLGTVPHRYWPFVVLNFDEEPSAFCYALARSFRIMQPIRLDWADVPRDYLLERIKSMLRNKFALCFGFNAPSECFRQFENEGVIPIPHESESISEEGMAALAVGFDDNMSIPNTKGDTSGYGAILIQCSLGEGWGNKGFGWLPYDYIISERAKEWWTMTDSFFTDLEEFGLSNS